MKDASPSYVQFDCSITGSIFFEMILQKWEQAMVEMRTLKYLTKTREKTYHICKARHLFCFTSMGCLEFQ